jgi:hypothetical protein
MLCLDDKDVQICNALTTTDLNAMGAYVEKMKKERDVLFENIIEKLLRKVQGLNKDGKITLTL